MIRLVKWIGYDTHSEQLTKITNGVFVAQFFNTGILILLAFANLDEVSIPVLKNIAQGPFYDYTDEWYSLVGARIVTTAIINALMPLGTECVPIVQKWFT